VREDRIVVLDRADVVGARNVSRGDDCDDAGCRAHRGKLETAQPAMRDRAHADRHMQRIARLRQVVGVEGFTGDVEFG
jgi:hypothetical protein